VRGKVVSFKLDDPSVGDEEKGAATKEAIAYFKLASAYTKFL
jgi:aminoglycoside phosphotransferase family enzyme